MQTKGIRLVCGWLPPRRGGSTPSFRLTLHPGAITVTARPGETLLEAGLRAGLALPYECRAGGCGKCVATVLNGTVDHGSYQPAALTAAMRARGETLMCCASALTDVEVDVDVPSLSTATDAKADQQARVVAIDRLAPDVIRLWLLPQQRLDYVAGQYLDIVLDDGATRSYSLANPPREDEPRIELHIRRQPGGRFSTIAFERLAIADTLRFRGPFGRFALHDSSRPLLFIAGATGFAPIKAILEDAFRRGIRRPMYLYWGVRTQADLYMAGLALEWQATVSNFHFVPVLSEPPADGTWSGRSGFVHQVMLEDFPDMRGYELYACGSVGMIEAAVPDFLAHGIDADFCYSDAFVPGTHQRPSTPDLV